MTEETPQEYMVAPPAPLARVGEYGPVRRRAQAFEQAQYDPDIITQALLMGDMRKMSPDMRLAFVRAVCLSIGVNPLTQPFSPLERQDKTVWLYPNATCAQQLAKLHRVTFTQIMRRHYTLLEEPMYEVTVTASLPDGRSVPGLAVASLTKKKRTQQGKWPDGNPKFQDALDEDGEPILLPLRGEALANAIKRTDTQALRRATLALVGLGWAEQEVSGQGVSLDMQTGELLNVPAPETRPRLMERPAEQGKSTADHIADLYGDPLVPAGGTKAGAFDPRKAIQMLHLTHNAQEEWMGRYWEKMARRYGVRTADALTDTQLELLYREARETYDAQDARAQDAAATGDGPGTADDPDRGFLAC